MEKSLRMVQCNVAIIGSGFAGLAAAIEAALASPQVKVHVIEKMHTAGGNSIMNAGQVAAVDSEEQRKAGIQDSVELMMQDMLKAGADLNHPNLLRIMIETSNDVVRWTKEELGIEYRPRVTQLGGHSVPRTLSTPNACGNDIIQPMLLKLKELPNAEILLDTSFVSFLTDGQGGIKGIRVKSEKRDNGDQETWDLLCADGVVLASGGFGSDVAFRSIQNPSYDENVMSTNQPGATAEVIKEALKLGAMSVQLSRIQLGPWTSPDEQGFGEVPFFCMGAGFPYGIIVDPDTSLRFINELGHRNARSMAILKLKHPVVCFTDSDGAEHSLKKELEEMKPSLKSFHALEELATEYHMDPTILRATVSLYNKGVMEGRDQFGKPFRDDLTPIQRPPFYAARLWPKVHHCMGGLHINSKAQVQHIDGYSIPGLYAAGEVAGGVHGDDRLGSCATLDCLAFGRIAGRNAAACSARASDPHGEVAQFTAPFSSECFQ